MLKRFQMQILKETVTVMALPWADGLHLLLARLNFVPAMWR